MPFDWREYLGVSRYLEGKSGDGFSEEAAARAGISRAYYAAHISARNYAEDQWGYLPPRERETSHRDLRDRFHLQGRLDIEEKLRELAQWRKKSDYDNEFRANFSRMHANAIRRAEEVLNLLT